MSYALITLRLLVLALLIALVVLLVGKFNKDGPSDICENFSFSFNNKTYLPSDIIRISASCENTQEKKTLCPSWDITSSSVDIKYLLSDIIQNETRCELNVAFQVLNFKNSAKRVHLLLNFQHPKGEPISEIDIERSDDGEFCGENRDCYHQPDQYCSHARKCTCHDKWIFIRSLQKCVPAVYRVNGQCQYPEQCQILRTTCKSGICECKTNYEPDATHTECIPEAVHQIGGQCLYTSQCQIPNSLCTSGICLCKKFYEPDVNFTQCSLIAVYQIMEQCLYTEQCRIPNSSCRLGSCKCDSFYKPDDSLTQCLPEETNTNFENGGGRNRGKDSYKGGVHSYVKGTASHKAGFGLMFAVFLIKVHYILWGLF